MGLLSPILIGAVVAGVAVVATRALLRTRAGSAERGAGSDGTAGRLFWDAALIILGAFLMAISVVVGLELLQVDDPPEDLPFESAPGIATSLSPHPRVNRGFVAAMSVTVQSCDEPVDVRLVFAGTAEFFEDNDAALSGPTRITVAVPSPTLLDDHRVGLGAGYSTATSPATARYSPALTAAHFTTQGETAGLATLGVNGVVRSWASHLAPVIVRFRADWLTDRGLGSCYLRLPAMAGDETVIGAQDGRGEAYRSEQAFVDANPDETRVLSNDGLPPTLWVRYERHLAVAAAVTVVDAMSNEIVAAEPQIRATSGRLPALVCVRRTLATGRLGNLEADVVRPSVDTGFVIRAGAFAELARSADCSGTVTITEPGAGRWRDLVLLLTGAVFSLGAAIILEVVLDMYRRRRPQGSTS